MQTQPVQRKTKSLFLFWSPLWASKLFLEDLLPSSRFPFECHWSDCILCPPSKTVTGKGNGMILIGLDQRAILIPSHRSHLLVPSPWVLGFQRLDLGGDTPLQTIASSKPCVRPSDTQTKWDSCYQRERGSGAGKGSRPYALSVNISPYSVSTTSVYFTGVYDLWVGTFQLSFVQNIHEFLCGFFVVFTWCFARIFPKYISNTSFFLPVTFNLNKGACSSGAASSKSRWATWTGILELESLGGMLMSILKDAGLWVIFSSCHFHLFLFCLMVNWFFFLETVFFLFVCDELILFFEESSCFIKMLHMVNIYYSLTPSPLSGSFYAMAVFIFLS